MVTWRELWVETTATVGERTEAMWLCEVAASAVDRAEFMAMLDEPATERMIAHLDAMVARLATGEPLQYVLGQWSFRHIEVAIDRRVLIPRPETELVAGAAIDKARTFEPSRTVVDLGTGSGVIGLSLAAELPIDGTTVWITDASVDALDVARANLAGLGRKGRNVRIGEGSWFDAVPADLRFDVIVSNPPYVPAPSDALPTRGPARAWDAGRDGRVVIDRLIREAPAHLRPGGVLLMVHSDICGIDASLAGMRDAGLEPDVAARRRGPLGPLMRARVRHLEDHALLEPGARDEDVAVLRGQATGA